MFLSRRDFIRLGSLCAISATVSLGLVKTAAGQKRVTATGNTGMGFEIPIQAQNDPLFFMSKQTFTQYLETTFLIDPGYTRPINTTLIEVTDTRSAHARKRNTSGMECFILTFRVNGDRMVKQGTYQVRHDALGTFELFVVPSTDDRGGKFFEAVINRVVE